MPDTDVNVNVRTLRPAEPVPPGRCPLAGSAHLEVPCRPCPSVDAACCRPPAPPPCSPRPAATTLGASPAAAAVVPPARSDIGVSALRLRPRPGPAHRRPLAGQPEPHAELPAVRRRRPHALQLPRQPPAVHQRRGHQRRLGRAELPVPDPHAGALPDRVGAGLRRARATPPAGTRPTTWSPSWPSARPTTAPPGSAPVTSPVSPSPTSPRSRHGTLSNGNVPYYCIHKTLAGLLDVWRYIGNTQARDGAAGPRRLGRHPHRPAERQPDAVDAGHRVRRHERRADRHLPEDRRRPVAHRRPAVRPRRRVQPPGLQPGPAQRPARQHAGTQVGRRRPRVQGHRDHPLPGHRQQRVEHHRQRAHLRRSAATARPSTSGRPTRSPATSATTPASSATPTTCSS